VTLLHSLTRARIKVCAAPPLPPAQSCSFTNSLPTRCIKSDGGSNKCNSVGVGAPDALHFHAAACILEAVTLLKCCGGTSLRCMSCGRSRRSPKQGPQTALFIPFYSPHRLFLPCVGFGPTAPATPPITSPTLRLARAPPPARRQHRPCLVWQML